MKRSMHEMGKMIAGVMALALLTLSLPVPAVAQDGGACESDYAVQSGDWLAKIAEQHYGDYSLYPAIVLATNARSTSDSSYATIADPWLIEPDWKLCLPGLETAQSGFTVESLKNTEYLSEWTASGTAQLTDGQYQESIVPGSATKINVMLRDRMAFGYTSDGQPLAAVVLITDPGGSGTFRYLSAVIEQDGEMSNVATTLLGDRAQIESVAITEGQIVVGMITHGPDDPMCCPTQRVVQTYALQGDQLVEIASETPESASSMPQRMDVAGVYKGWFRAASSPGIDSTLYLNVDNSLRLVDNYLNGELPIIEVGTWQINDDDTVGIIITGQEESAYDAPNTITLTLEENVLTTTQEEEAYGQLGRKWVQFDALARDPASVPYDSTAATQAIEARGFVGIYKAMLPAATCCGRDVTLTLAFDDTARLKTDYLNNESPIVQVGYWQLNEQGAVVLTLTGQEDQTYDTPNVITFQMEGDLLTAIEYDESLYGSAGLEFYHFQGLVEGSLASAAGAGLVVSNRVGTLWIW